MGDRGGSSNRAVKYAVVGGAAAAAVAAGVAYYVYSQRRQQQDGTEHGKIPSAGEDSHSLEQADDTVPAASVPAPTGASAAETVAPAATAASAPTEVARREGTKGDDDEVVSVDENAHPTIKKSTLVDMLGKLYKDSEVIMAEIKQQVDNGEISAEQASMLAAQRLQVLDSEACTEYGLTQQDLLSAQEVYSKDSEVKRWSSKIQELITSAISADVPPPTMSVEEICDKVRENGRITMELLQDLKNEILASGKSGQEAQQEFQMQFMMRMPELQQKSMDILGVGAEEFQNNLTNYMNDPRLFEAIQQSQQEMANCQQTLLNEW